MSREYAAFISCVMWVCFVLGFVLAAAGCQGVPRAFLDGERAAYKAIAPAHKAYIDADETLTETQKKDRLRTLRAWRFSLDRAEKVAE